jgi:pimeloyl-ACP methyl ester carboxylesterase
MIEHSERRARFEARLAKERTTREHGDDLRAAAGVVVAATQGVMGAVADMQQAFQPPVISSISSLVNAVVRGTTGLVGTGIDAALAALTPFLGASVPGDEREAVLAAVNGVIGDRLFEQKSPLAIPMTLRPALDEVRRGALLVFVHGSSMNDRQWTATRRVGEQRVAHDHGRALLDDIARDVTLAYLHYNTGRHVKHNGDDLALLLEREHEGFDEIVVVAHSMGGLVARSAVCAAERDGHAWRKKLSVLATLGTPHHGSPLERIGHIAELVLGATPWTAPLGALATVRSAGVTDLRYGNVVDVDADRFAFTPDARTHAPLPHGVRCYAIAGTNSAALDDDVKKLASDNLVPVPSALGMHDESARTLAFTDSKIVVATDHLALLSSDDVYRALLAWIEGSAQ